ncbi:FIG00450213: hypothetical protein [hydrothermal vent metagenome]|uniref:Uncharacterized protein n=1 Tax=hydrothermal vent metagenome TaxID=652676 RepID=A0A1W1E3A0_9ZZZZ
MSEIYKVIKIISPTEIVINVGKDKIHQFDEFLVYSIEEELFDPETTESLGMLESVKGTVKATHIQEQLTTLQSSKFIVTREAKKTITKPGGVVGMFGFDSDSETIIEPEIKKRKELTNIELGDLVKKIN